MQLVREPIFDFDCVQNREYKQADAYRDRKRRVVNATETKQQKNGAHESQEGRRNVSVPLL